ncbi:MAG: TetR/AcrR family transcriptional regulator [Eubacteriales bacterium]|nr:TetR/AcrR family transcriptional regulator [Eubacteriales bacterium]
MDQGKTQKKNTMTRECIFTALLILMEKKPYAEITITDIAKKAGVSRMSYYRLYRSKDDILIQYFNDVFENLLDTIKQTENIDRYQFALLIFQTVGQNERLLKAILRAELYEMVMRCLIEYCSYLAEHVFGMDMSSARTDYRIYEEAGRFSLLLMRWVERDLKETPEEIARYLAEGTGGQLLGF